MAYRSIRCKFTTRPEKGLRTMSLNFHIYQPNFSKYLHRNLVFQIVGKPHLCFQYIKSLGRDEQLKRAALLVFFLKLVNIEKPINNGLLIISKNMAFFSDIKYDFRSSCSPGYLLAVASYRIARIVIFLGQLELYHLIYPRFFTGRRMLVYLRKSSRIKVQVEYLYLYCNFSVIDMASIDSWWEVFSRMTI